MKKLYFVIWIIVINCSTPQTQDGTHLQTSIPIAKYDSGYITERDIFLEHFVDQINMKKMINDDLKVRYFQTISNRRLLFEKVKKKSLMKSKKYREQFELYKNEYIRKITIEYLYKSFGLPFNQLKKYLFANKHKMNFLPDTTTYPNDILLEVYFNEVARHYFLSQYNLDQDTTMTVRQRQEKEAQLIGSKTVKLLDNIFDKYNIKFLLKNKSKQNLESFYQQFKSNYQTQEVYEVYHFESSSKNEISQFYQDIKREAILKKAVSLFKDLAKSTSSNPKTAQKQGYLGNIKALATLPYGIGFLPALESEIKRLDIHTDTGNFLTKPIVNRITKKWHVFLLVGYQPSQIKSFERVKYLLAKDYQRDDFIDNNQVIATYRNREVLEKEVKQYIQTFWFNIPYSFDNLKIATRYYIHSQILPLEIHNLKLLEIPSFYYRLNRFKESFWNDLYISQYSHEIHQIKLEDKSKLLKKMKAFINRTNQDSELDSTSLILQLGLFNYIPSEAYREWYAIHSEEFTSDGTLLAFESVTEYLFSKVSEYYFLDYQNHLFKSLSQQFNYQILISDPYDAYSLEILSKKAKEYQKNHRSEKLIEYLRKLQFLKPDDVSFQDSITRLLASTLLSVKNYYPAITEYRRLIYRYPNNPKICEIEFAIAFVFLEYIDKYKSIPFFQKVIDQYPSCHLVKSAKWQIQNIKHGGKLLPKLK